MIGLSCLPSLAEPQCALGLQEACVALLPPVLPPPLAAPSFTASLLPRKLLPSLLPHSGTQSATPCHPAALSPSKPDKLPLADEALLPCASQGGTIAQHLASGPPAGGRSSESYLQGGGSGKSRGVSECRATKKADIEER